jgi:hypothetical protein
VGGLDGTFVLDVTLAGANPELAPRTLPGTDFQTGGVVRRLTSADAERLGFSTSADTLVTALRGDKGAPWMLVHLGDFTRTDEERIAEYAEVLLSAVEAAGEVEASRLMWAMMQRLVGDVASAPRAAAAALSDLAHATLCSVRLQIRRSDGAVVLDVEDGNASPALEARPEVGTLSFALQVPPHYDATLGLYRQLPDRFTLRDQRLGDVAATMLSAWATSLIRSGSLDRDRRAHARSFDQVLDEQIAVAEGDLTLLLIRADAASSAPAMRQSWLGEIRRHLRPLDIAGMLTTGEIGVLLPHTSAAAARAVLDRLRARFETVESLSPLAAVPVGVAMRRPGGDSVLLSDAREAAAHTSAAGSSLADE